VVILGCAHRGMVNTLRHAQKLTGQDKVYAVIGGTHLLRTTDERVARTIAELKEMGLQKIGVSHCTGFYASARLAEAFGNGFFLNNAGSQMTLP
jgi:7,8-dihydropterin-6-yl-methyl-4-(beta-D-ribofuranosyl)aminobenzene 5'-phosphate synthase